jgi:hypothetical protein
MNQLLPGRWAVRLFLFLAVLPPSFTCLNRGASNGNLRTP